MTRDEILALLARRAEAWSRLDAQALASDYVEDAKVDSPLGGASTHGRIAIERVYQTYFTAFPDLEMRQEDVLIDGDHAAVFSVFHGTDSGGFMGMAPTGRKVTIPVVFFYELKDGQILRDRRIYDFTGLLLQVGALKAKPS
jgi:steroid delta-isomerase-like uncharacterized protein